MAAYFPDKKTYSFEDIEVDTSRGCLSRRGEEKHLRQKAFQVLVYLLERRDQLVSKNELFESVWENTAVTDDVLVQCVTEIRRVIGDDPHKPRFIKTVPKSGYRFIGPIEENSGRTFTQEITRVEFEIEEESGERNHTPMRPEPSVLRTLNRRTVTACMVLVCVFGAAFYFGWPSNSQVPVVRLPQMDGRKMIAVMFFENRSGSAQYEWLGEGLTDMLNAGLSRSDQLTVLERGALNDLAKRAGSDRRHISMEQATEIARQSRAANFITGSFAIIGESVRVDVQLYSAEGGLQTTETLTVAKPEQILTEVDLLSLKIANHLNALPTGKTDIAGVMTDDLEAYRFYSLGVEKAQAFHNLEAIELLEKAAALDPEFAMAHARIGYAYAVTWAQTEEGKPHLEKAFKLSDRLSEKDRMNINAWYAIANRDFPSAINSFREIINRYPFEIEAYWRLAKLLEGENRQAEAAETIRSGLAVDSESGNLYNSWGIILAGQGKIAEAIAAHERYVALAPTEPNAYDSLGLTYQWSGNYEKAIETFDRALALDPRFEVAIIHLGNTYIQLGRYREAIAVFQRYIENAPSKLEKVRGHDSICYVQLKQQRLDLAERSSAQVRGMDAARIWNAYLLAVKRGRAQNAVALEKELLAGISLVDRGKRPNRRLDLYYRGMIALNNDRPDEAIDYFRQTLTNPPTSWHHEDFEDCLAKAFLRLGQFDEAIGEVQRILRTNPRYPMAHFYLAQAYEAKGLNEEARNSYLTFLEVWKGADNDIPEIIMARARAGV
jgi:tetratricopeptide (TPR) repeat protein/DNA-binding winged helix-turn-helix (wHTH) protein